MGARDRSRGYRHPVGGGKEAAFGEGNHKAGTGSHSLSRRSCPMEDRKRSTDHAGIVPSGTVLGLGQTILYFGQCELDWGDLSKFYIKNPSSSTNLGLQRTHL